MATEGPIDLSRANRDLNMLYPEVRVRLFKLIELMKTHYKPIFLVEGYRSMERQKWLYEKKIKVTNALPGNSWHNFSLAVDVAFLAPNPYADAHPWLDLRRMAVSVGFEPISRFDNEGTLTGDLPHLQCRYGMTMLEVKKLHAFGGHAAVFAAIDKIRGVEQGSEWLPLPPILEHK